MQAAKRKAKRTGIAIVGGVVVIVGIIAIPYPGPGWLIVFTGLAILATEFTWAQRLLGYARGKYEAWTGWLRRQHLAVRIAFVLLTGAVVITTMWLFNAFGMIDTLLHLGFSWVHSPFMR